MISKIIRKLFRITKKISKDLFCAFILICLMLIPRKRDNGRKVMFFGEPIISGKYITEGIKSIVKSSIVFVKEVYSIHSVTDYTYVTPKLLPFLKQIHQNNIYIIFYDSIDVFFGPLSKHVFAIYKKITKKKLIALPYGGDSYLYSKISNLQLRHVLNINYEKGGLSEKYLTERYFWINRLADFRIGCLGHLYNLSTWDMLPVHYYPVNILKPHVIPKKYDKFTIIHSPNHRGVKGTEYIIAAVKSLQSKGYDIELKLLEKIPNTQVIEELYKSHLLIEQVVGGYALSAMEGMAVGIPVIANIGIKDNDVFRNYSHLNECPIVNAELSVQSIEEAILYVIKDYKELCKKSLDYIEKYHSYTACEVMWEKIFESIEKNERPINYFHPLIGQYLNDYKEKVQKSTKKNYEYFEETETLITQSSDLC